MSQYECVLYLYFRRFHLIKILDVCIVDPLHVGPPACGLLTHIIKDRGLPPAIHCHIEEGTLSSVSSVSLCLVNDCPVRTSSPFVWGFKYILFREILHLVWPYLISQSKLLIHPCGVYMPKQPWCAASHKHPHPQIQHAYSQHLSLLFYTVQHDMDPMTTLNEVVGCSVLPVELKPTTWEH